MTAWKQVWVPVRSGCLVCDMSVCDDCAPAGQPLPGDRRVPSDRETRALEIVERALDELKDVLRGDA